VGVCLVLGAAILVAFGWAPARSWLGLPGTPRDESPDTDPSQQLSALAGEWQAWWNKVTRMLRERGYRPDAKTTLTDWQTKPIHLDWESTDEYRHAYLELRNEGLEFVERAVQLGEMDEQMRIRFHEPAPRELWELNAFVCDNYLKPWRSKRPHL
jgi:hypothetical protein